MSLIKLDFIDQITRFISNNLDRVKTSFILVAILSVIIFIDSRYVYLMIIGAISFIAIREIRHMFEIEDIAYLNIAVGSIFVIGLFVDNLHLIVVLAYIVLISLSTYFDDYDENNAKALLYPIFGLSFFMSLINGYDSYIIIFLLLSISLTDIGAFVVGKKWGKTHFSDKSPNKTLEGVVGGVIIGSLIAGIFGSFFHNFLLMFFIAFVISAVSIFGDLYESSLKRKANIKDSGDILPGHGGVLDRLDGYIFSAPILFVMLEIFI